MRTTTTFDGALYALVLINAEAFTGVAASYKEAADRLPSSAMLNAHGHTCTRLG